MARQRNRERMACRMRTIAPTKSTNATDVRIAVGTSGVHDINTPRAMNMHRLTLGVGSQQLHLIR